MMKSSIDVPDRSSIPAPDDDGATRHLVGMRMASISLAATRGGPVDLLKLAGRSVVYACPRTGKPGVENPEGWDMIPGARGCTPQACSETSGMTLLERFTRVIEDGTVRHVFHPVFRPDRSAGDVIEWLSQSCELTPRFAPGAP